MKTEDALKVIEEEIRIVEGIRSRVHETDAEIKKEHEKEIRKYYELVELKLHPGG